MRRDLKFRAYIEDEHRFLYCDDSDDNYLGTFFTAVRQIEKMSGKKIPKDQFTSLRDQNGKEIWEGDIVKRNPSNPPYDDMKAVKWINLHNRNGWNVARGHYWEVIGNIYGNPELLERRS